MTIDEQRTQHWKNWHAANRKNPVDLATMVRERRAIERLDRIRPSLRATRAALATILPCMVTR